MFWYFRAEINTESGPTPFGNWFPGKMNWEVED